jgi:hypothetical protein
MGYVDMKLESQAKNALGNVQLVENKPHLSL